MLKETSALKHNSPHLVLCFDGISFYYDFKSTITLKNQAMKEILLHYILYWSPCFVLCYVVNPGHNFPLHRWPFSCHSPLGSARAKKRAFGQQQKQKQFTCVEITNIFQQNEHSLGSGSPQVKLNQQSVPQHISRCFSWVPSAHPIGKDHMQCQLRCFSLHTKTYFNCTTCALSHFTISLLSLMPAMSQGAPVVPSMPFHGIHTAMLSIQVAMFFCSY